jgi:hypothetical protein
MKLATTVDTALFALAAAAAAAAFMLAERFDPLADVTITAQRFAAMLLMIAFVAAWRPAKAPFATTFAVAFAILVVNIHLELAFFMPMALDDRASLFAMGTANCAIVVLLARLVSAGGTGAPTIAEWAARGTANWVLRLALAAFIYIVLYVVVGAAAYTYTKPFYEDAAGLGLQVPPIATVLMAQVLRGAVYATAALVFALTTPRVGAPTLVAMGLFAGLGGVAPLVGNSDWPLDMRIAHTIEIILQNAPFAAFALWLFGTRTAEAR